MRDFERGKKKYEPHQAEHTLDALANEAERAGLLAVTPHLKAVSGADGLAAKGSWSLFASALPGAVRTIDVVEAGNAGLHGEVVGVVNGQLLHAQLLQTVGILRLGGPGIRFLQARVGSALRLYSTTARW